MSDSPSSCQHEGVSREIQQSTDASNNSSGGGLTFVVSLVTYLYHCFVAAPIRPSPSPTRLSASWPRVSCSIDALETVLVDHASPDLALFDMSHYWISQELGHGVVFNFLVREIVYECSADVDDIQLYSQRHGVASWRCDPNVFLGRQRELAALSGYDITQLHLETSHSKS